jgi:predicted ATP-grasp superfamily ATP-dependent carboligase
MAEVVEIWEQPDAKELYMIVGWRQWADAGSISSNLPQYLINMTEARQIGAIDSEEFYLFQIPGTHDLVRPEVTFVDGFPDELETPENQFFYAGEEERGVIFFLGDEPQLHVERYVAALLDVAQRLNVRCIISLAGVYGELPYDRERTVSAIYSLPELKDRLEDLAVTFSDYQGGASISSVLCRRAMEREVPHVGFYAFVPTYDFTNVPEIGNAIRIENDFMAWLGVMRRVNRLLGLEFELGDLEEKSERLIKTVDAKVAELDEISPTLGVRDYMQQLSDSFEERPFEPLGSVWEDELNRLFDDEESPGT